MTSKHWKHQDFERTFLTLSSGTTLQEAVKEWGIVQFWQSLSLRGCDACKTSIKKTVVLENNLNSSRLIIGLDCLENFFEILEKGEIQNTLNGKQRKVHLKNHLKEGLGRHIPRHLPARTGLKDVVDWFWSQHEAGLLPEELRDAVRTLKYMGVTPTEEDADRIVEYYIKTRKFPLAALVPFSDSPAFCRRHSVPAEITIAEIPGINRLISEKVVVVPDHPDPYVLLKEGDLWKRMRVILVNGNGKEIRWPDQYGMYYARMMDPEWKPVRRRKGRSNLDPCVHLLIGEKDAESDNLFPGINFFTPSNRGVEENGYVGRLRGKVVIPSRLVVEKGRYLCFVLGDKERYVRAWVISKEKEEE